MQLPWGGGKAIVSKHYILQGIKALLSKYRVDRFFEEYKPSEEAYRQYDFYIWSCCMNFWVVLSSYEVVCKYLLAQAAKTAATYLLSVGQFISKWSALSRDMKLFGCLAYS